MQVCALQMWRKLVKWNGLLTPDFYQQLEWRLFGNKSTTLFSCDIVFYRCTVVGQQAMVEPLLEWLGEVCCITYNILQNIIYPVMKAVWQFFSNYVFIPVSSPPFYFKAFPWLTAVTVHMGAIRFFRNSKLKKTVTLMPSSCMKQTWVLFLQFNPTTEKNPLFRLCLQSSRLCLQ